MADFPWFKNYPEGIPNEIYPGQYNSLLEMFEENFQSFSDQPAYLNMGKALTFNDVDALSRDFAAYLQANTALKKGDRFAIQMPNLLQYPVILFGALRAGLVVVSINPLYTSGEMKHQINDSGSKGIVILENFACNLEKILSQTEIEYIYITKVGDLIGGLKGWIINKVVKYIKKMVPDYDLPSAKKLKDALEIGKQNKYERPEVSGTDVALLQYTGGTTGVSKGAVLSHGNLVANVMQSDAWFIGLEKGKDTVITALPLYHIFALTVNCLLMVHLGAKNILITNPRDMSKFMKELGKYKFSIISGVNTLFNAMLNHDEFKNLDFSDLKITVAGGMALQKSVARKWEEITGCPIVEGYGLSETSPVLTVNPLDGNHRLGTIGLPLPSTVISIRDDQGEEIQIGERGEICAKGPQVMLNYWQMPEENKNCFFGDFFRTGDIGIMDEDGFISIVDRKKDMILVSGFNVYPNEVEGVVAMHEKVLEVAAIGVDDPNSTEAVKIFVVRKGDDLSKEEIIEHCREHLTGYKVPKHVEFRDELPKTNVGKILRRELKNEEQNGNSN